MTGPTTRGGPKAVGPGFPLQHHTVRSDGPMGPRAHDKKCAACARMCAGARARVRARIGTLTENRGAMGPSNDLIDISNHNHSVIGAKTPGPNPGPSRAQIANRGPSL